MRRYLALALILLILLPVAAESTGTLTIPTVFGNLSAGVQNLSLFDGVFNQIRDYINNRELSQAACSTRPSASVSGRLFFCTDTSVLYADTGSAWTQIASAALYTDQLTGLTTANEPTATATSINVAVGSAASDDTLVANRVLMTIASATAGNTAGTFVAGNYQNKLDAGAIAPSTTYHIYVIQRLDTGATDILYSTSASAPTMPSNFTRRRRIGAFLTDGVSLIRQYVQVGDEFLYAADPPLDIDVTNAGTGAVLRALSVPSGIKVGAILNTETNHVATQFFTYFSSPDAKDLAPSEVASPLLTSSTSEAAPTHWPVPLRIRTNTAQQIRSRQSASGAGDILKIVTLGWIDLRGRGCNQPC